MYIDISEIVNVIITNIELKLIELEKNEDNFNDLKNILKEIYILNNKDLIKKIKSFYIILLNKDLEEKENKAIDYIFNNDNYLDSLLSKIVKEKDLNIEKINEEIKNYLNNQKKLKYLEKIIENIYYPEQAKIKDSFKYLPF